MNSTGYWGLFWNWFERRVLGREKSPLLPRHRGWRDFMGDIAVGEGPPVLPEASAADLQRRLKALAPRHVHVAIHVGPGGTATKIGSWRWLRRGPWRRRYRPRLPTHRLRACAATTLNSTRSYLSRTCRSTAGSPALWWEHDDRAVLALEPIPIPAP